MRRLSKSKKGKGANKGEKDVALEEENQDNGSIQSDEDEAGDEKPIVQNKKVKRGRKGEVAEDDSHDSHNEDEAPLNRRNVKAKKGRRSVKESNGEDENHEVVKNELEKQDVEEEKEEEYEVEKVVDCRVFRGVKQYRIRWKGFEEDKDTWELETDLSCPDLIEKYVSENADAVNISPKSVKEKKKAGKEKKRKMPSDTSKPKAKQQHVVEPVTEEDGQKVYEVERVVEVHFKKNGEREFLIRWKGFTHEDDTWEPESNLNCKELIEKFMEKVEKAKELTSRELRVNPQSTKRFTLNTREHGRRLSGRNQSKQRVTYFNTE